MCEGQQNCKGEYQYATLSGNNSQQIIVMWFELFKQKKKQTYFYIFHSHYCQSASQVLKLAQVVMWLQFAAPYYRTWILLGNQLISAVKYTVYGAQ